MIQRINIGTNINSSKNYKKQLNKNNTTPSFHGNEPEPNNIIINPISFPMMEIEANRIELSRLLNKSKDKDKNPRFTTEQKKLMSAFVKTPTQLKLANFLIKNADKNYDGLILALIIDKAQSPEQATLAAGLSQMKDKNEDFALNDKSVLKIMTSSTRENAQLKLDLAKNILPLSDKSKNKAFADYNYIPAVVSKVQNKKQSTLAAEMLDKLAASRNLNNNLNFILNALDEENDIEPTDY